MTLAEEVMRSGRHDRVAARNLLAGLTSLCLSRETFERHRRLLLSAGIPAAYLPTAAELGRTDLV